ncbi:hypothetical protein HY439_01760 [Candidatus Microgenomates bacterium]|nr:hypothetical protein [Candidatus Microgenomates bacterium]
MAIFRLIFSPKIAAILSTVILAFALVLSIPRQSVAQFPPLPTSTPTPTLASLPLTGGTTPATPTATVTKAPAATTPVAGNALPTFTIFGIAVIFLVGGFLWQLKTPQKVS